MGSNTITVYQLAEILNIGRYTAYELCHRCDFYPAFRIGRKILVNMDKLNQWLEEQGQKEV